MQERILYFMAFFFLNLYAKSIFENPNSKFQNPNSKFQIPKSKFPKSKIQNSKSKSCYTEVITFSF